MSKTSLLRGFAFAIVLPLALALAADAALAGCRSGYVWRDAQDGDGACVTPAERAEAKAQNANARNNRKVGGGPYGPNTCRDGYVWREAFAGDVVCVTPHERQQAKHQNTASASRSN
jgi:cytosine/adenosine deaminase-related metal-dependent hydrolase